MSMEILPWDDKYSVGIASIDRQHRQLVDTINLLYREMSQGKAQSVIEDILNKLVGYTATHFKTEEDYFKQVDYADAAAHIKEHQAFVAKVQDFIKDFKFGKASVSRSILDFLSKWLIGHIQGSDKKYTQALLDAGIR